jgi:hypothetical protein
LLTACGREGSPQDELIAALHEISAFGSLAAIRCPGIIADVIVLAPGMALRPKLTAEQHPQTYEESHTDNRRRRNCGEI